MKKFIAIVMLLLMVFTLAACSSGPDVKALKESYNTLADAYNDMIGVATENGWDQDTDTVDGLNQIASMISQVKPVIEDPSNYTQDQIDKLKDSCDQLYSWVGEMQSIVSEPYGG